MHDPTTLQIPLKHPSAVAAKQNHLRALLAVAGRIAVLFITTVGSAVLVFLTQLMLVRLLTMAEYGQLVALLAFINLMTHFSAYGFGWFWLRVFGEEGWNGFRWIGPSMRLLTLTSSVATIVLVGYIWNRFDAGFRWPTSILAIPVLLGQVFVETTSARLQLEERFFALAAWQSLTQTGRFATVAVLLAIGLRESLGPLVGYASLGSLLTLTGIASSVQMSRSRIALRGHGSRPATKLTADPVSLLHVAREAMPFSLWTIFYLLYFQSVVILLAMLVGKPAAAVYNVAFQVISAAHLVPNVIYSKYIFGKAFRWSQHDTGRFFAAFHVGVLGMTILGVGSMVVVVIVSPVVVPILFGRTYSASVPIIMALSITILTRFLQTAYASLFCSKENMKRQVLYGGVAAAFCVSLNIILLPGYGLTGAIITQVATELLLLGLYMRGAKRLNKEIGLWQSFRFSTFRQAFDTLRSSPAD